MADSTRPDYQSELSEQDLSAGELVDLEPDELQHVPEPPSRLAGYNQSPQLEEGDNGLQTSDEPSEPEITKGGNQTEAIDRQTALEQAANQGTQETKTAN